MSRDSDRPRLCKRERDAAARRANRRSNDQLQSLPQADWCTGSSPIAPRPITVLRRGEVEQPGDAVGPGNAGLPSWSSGFVHAAQSRQRGQPSGRAWPTGSPARRMCSPGVRSPIAYGITISAGESSKRRTTSVATAHCQRIPSCSTGSPYRAPRSWPVAQGTPSTDRL